MSYQIFPDRCQSFQVVQQGFLQADGLPFSTVLSEEQIERAFDEESESLFGQEDDDVYTPALTLWAFLSQVIQAGAQRSCNAAVERLRTLCLLLGMCARSADMNLEDLRGKCPHMIRKEIWAHCLAYNLICQSRAAAAVLSEEQTPRTISFAGALQSVAGAMVQASTTSPSILRALAEQKLASIASHRVGNRPNRIEPRAVKRRPKNQKLLSKPRDEARAELGVVPASGG